MPIEITVEVVHQPVGGEQYKDTIKMGLGDHYSTGLQNVGFLFKIVKVEMSGIEFIELKEAKDEQDNRNV